MENMIFLSEIELKNINGGETGDAAEALGIMIGAELKYGLIIGNFVGSYKIYKRFFS